MMTGAIFSRGTYILSHRKKIIFLSCLYRVPLLFFIDNFGIHLKNIFPNFSKLTESKTNGRVAQVVSALSCSKDEFIDVIRQCHDPTGSLQGRVYGHHVLKRSIVYPGKWNFLLSLLFISYF